MPRKIGPLIIFPWGWDLKLPFGRWLTYSRADGRCAYIGRCVYIGHAREALGSNGKQSTDAG